MSPLETESGFTTMRVRSIGGSEEDSYLFPLAHFSFLGSRFSLMSLMRHFDEQ